MELGGSQLFLIKMILGHGIDIEELASIQNAVEKREGFAQRVLNRQGNWSALPVSKVADRSSIWLVVGQLKKLSQRPWGRELGNLDFRIWKY